jgi:hypothetical protein
LINELKFLINDFKMMEINEKEIDQMKEAYQKVVKNFTINN